MIMTMTVDDFREELEVDFARMCTELAEACFRQGRKDTPAHRIAVTTCRARIDTVLDLYLEMGRASA